MAGLYAECQRTSRHSTQIVVGLTWSPGTQIAETSRFGISVEITTSSRFHHCFRVNLARPLICANSSSMSSRGLIVGKGMPKALASTSCEPALHSPVREVVDRGQEPGEEPRIPVREAVDVAAQPDVARVHAAAVSVAIAS